MLKLPSELQTIHLVKEHFLVRFAKDDQDLDQLTKVRFAVFNQELKAGSARNLLIGRDQDRYDEHCHHLMMIDQRTDRVVGTYRMQTYAMAKQHYGFYSSQEFDLSPISQTIIDNAVEIGRACILKEYRGWSTFFLLWQGIAEYLKIQQKYYLFGCSSLMSENIAEGYATLDHLRKRRLVHQDFWVYPTEAYKCPSQSADASLVGLTQKIVLPRLLQFYLKFGARVCSDPAIDSTFKSIDFFTIFNIKHLTQKHSPFYVAD